MDSKSTVTNLRVRDPDIFYELQNAKGELKPSDD